MTAIATTASLTQRQVCLLQDHVASEMEPVEITYEHHFADGIYGRIMKVPAGTIVVGKPHRTEHLCVLLKGRLVVTADDGTLTELAAPAVFVASPGQKKAALVLEDLEFMNIHPTTTTDLDEIERQVIIPEEEFRANLLSSEVATRELLEFAKEVQP